MLKKYVKVFLKKKSICEVFINLKDNENPIFNNYNRRYSINHTELCPFRYTPLYSTYKLQPKSIIQLHNQSMNM